MKMFEIFNNYSNEAWQEDFWCKPLPFEEFVLSPQHMAHQGLTQEQLECFYEFVTKDPNLVFDPKRRYSILILLWGKGSGKDLCSSMFQNWIFYLTLCMHSPTDYFKMPGVEESIDIVNVAKNYTQATAVFFDRFSKRIQSWQWLQENFQIVKSGRLLNPELKNPRHIIRVMEASIVCTNSVRFHSLHTDSEGYEGFNILMFTMDEASAFKTEIEVDEDGKTKPISGADKIYDVLRTSAMSRNWPWLGLIISYPREKDDFTVRKFEEGQKPNSRTLGFKRFPWQVLPAAKYTGEFITWEGFSIPAEHKEEADLDPIGYKTRMLCAPASSKGGWFYNEAKVHAIFKPNLEQIAKFSNYDFTASGTKYMAHTIESWQIFNKYHQYVLHGDYSITNDRTVIMVAHPEEINREAVYIQLDDAPKTVTMTKKVVVDLILIWQPNKGALVSHTNIQEILTDLFDTLDICYASFDQLESAFSIERLKIMNKTVEKHNINTQDYILLRNLVYNEAVDCFNNELLKNELLNVVWTGKRVDHKSTSSKDIADCLAGVSRLIMENTFLYDLKTSVIDTDPASYKPEANFPNWMIGGPSSIINT